jgi:hypothetical protein
MNGTREWDWNRRTSRWKKENDGEWRSYGAHLGFRPDGYNTYVRHTIYDGEHYPIGADFIDCADGEYIDTTAPIAAFTISGPPGSGLVNLDLMPYWDDTDPSGWRGFWNSESLTVGVSGFYTFRVEEPDGDYFVYTDYLEVAPHMALPVLVSPDDGEVVSVGNVILDWDPVDQAETYRVDMQYSDDGGTTWNGMPNIYTDDTQATVSVDPETLYQWRVRARQFDLYGELDGESRSDWKEFATYDVFTIGGYLQYRTFSDSSNMYRGWLDFTKNNNPIDESDITQIELKDSAGNPVTIDNYAFFADSYFWGDWNDSTSSVDFSGPYDSSGFSIRFPEATNFPAGNYTYEATTSTGDLLTLMRNFPGATILPLVDVASMQYEWLIDGGLRLTWSVPAGGTYDQLRVDLVDQDWNALVSVRLPADKEELTIPAEWIQQMTDLKNPSSAIWRVQTRSYAVDGNNYARGFSDEINIPWGGEDLSEGLKIFVTSEDHVADFAGDPTLTGANAIEKADSFCNQDSNKPNDSVYKALLVDGILRDAITLTDWVLQPNTTYYRPYDDIEIGTTTNDEIFTAFYSDLTNSISDSELSVWTGIEGASDFTAGEDCSNWSSGSSGIGATGDSDAVDGLAFFSGWWACQGAHNHLYCVEQP